MTSRVHQADIAAKARQLGFALSGVCGVVPSRYAEQFLEWLRAGKHGSMEYLARNAKVRVDPGLLLPGARSIIMVGDLYHARDGERGSELKPASGRIARYARGRDYHKVLKKRLHTLADELRLEHPGAGFRSFVDTAPIMEREAAHLAGLGWIGKHTLLIHPRLGSYLFLGGVLTTLEIENSTDAISDHCGTCTRCIDACPTNAIAPYSVDASRCISYLTIENRGPIESRFHDAMGDWLYGCDICQEVCPHNSPRPTGADVGTIHPDYASARDSLPLLDVLGWTSGDRVNALAGTAMTRATLGMMKRNAVILAGNAIRNGCPEPHRSDLLSRLKELALDHADSPELASLAAATLARVRAE